MKCSRRYFAGVSAVFALLLAISTGALYARDLTPLTLSAAQTAKPKCINTCRARYRDCISLKQISQYECRGVYQDCTRYTCTGQGPG
jgi:hypothetical protein